MPEPLRYNRKFDELTEKEQELLEVNKKSIADFVEQSSSVSDVNYATRNAHAKTYAVAKGFFQISPSAPGFLKPFFDKEKYDIVIRLSNAHPKIIKKGKDIPAYGFAVKIINDHGNTIANYPLVNFPLFPINSVSTFLKLFTYVNRSFILAAAAQFLKVIPCFFTFPFIKNAAKLMVKRNHFMLSFNYHSVGAYRLGDHMAKIKLVPKSVEKHFGKSMKQRLAVDSYLTEHNFTADVYIQLCYDLKDQPVNKLNREWRNSPFIKIGTVSLDKGSLLDPRECSNELLSFNPFESKTIFQPVGRIQRLRKEAYQVSVQTRRKINKLLHGV
ncbi:MULTISPECIES: catalase [Chryseobacterium]|nr:MULTISPECIES: catalase [Chryseobacterium]